MAEADATRPALLVVEDDGDARARIRGELERRYGADYRVTCEGSALGGLEKLERMHAAAEPVALVLADQWMPDLTGEEFLTHAKALYPDAKRALLVDFGAWGERETADAMLRAMALGRMDYYVLKPWRSPDEFFHRTVTEFLHEWSRANSPVPQELTLVCARVDQTLVGATRPAFPQRSAPHRPSVGYRGGPQAVGRGRPSGYKCARADPAGGRRPGGPDQRGAGARLRREHRARRGF